MALCGRDVGDDFRRRTRRRCRMTTNVAFGGGEVLRYGIIINWKGERKYLFTNNITITPVLNSHHPPS